MPDKPQTGQEGKQNTPKKTRNENKGWAAILVPVKRASQNQEMTTWNGVLAVLIKCESNTEFGTVVKAKPPKSQVGIQIENTGVL
eukprot:3378049-Amphidinium_carterae.1